MAAPIPRHDDAINVGTQGNNQPNHRRGACEDRPATAGNVRETGVCVEGGKKAGVSSENVLRKEGTMKYINFNDDKIPLGKRKQAYVKWAISKGTNPIEAKRQANNKFGFDKKEGIFSFVIDHGRMGQASFTGDYEIFNGRDLRKYKKNKWMHMPNDDNRVYEIRRKYEKMGWDVIISELIG